MNVLNRRDFGKIALASIPTAMAFAKINSTFAGVKIGAQSYSFRTMPLDRRNQGVCRLWNRRVRLLRNMLNGRLVLLVDVHRVLHRRVVRPRWRPKRAGSGGAGRDAQVALVGVDG